jgi:hypothetical protein
MLFTYLLKVGSGLITFYPSPPEPNELLMEAFKRYVDAAK